MEGGSLSFNTCNLHRSSVKFHDFANDGEPEAETIVLQRLGGVVLAEPFENVRPESGADSRTRIRNRDPCLGAGVSEQDLYPTPSWSKADGVRQKVPTRWKYRLGKFNWRRSYYFKLYTGQFSAGNDLLPCFSECVK